MKEKILILAYMGTGKTYLAQQYKNITEVSFFEHKFFVENLLQFSTIEEVKGYENSLVLRSNYPQNYLTTIFDELNKGQIVLTQFTSSVFNLIETSLPQFAGIRIILAFPNINGFEEYAERFKNRGNSDAFISENRSIFGRLAETFEKAEGFEKINIIPGQFLEKAISEHKIELQVRGE